MIGLGVKIGTSIARKTYTNLFNYDTAILGGANGTSSKEGDGVILFTLATVATAAGTIISSVLSAGKKYKILFEAKSDTITGLPQSIGDNANTSTAVNTQNLNTSYQIYEYIINPTQTGCRLYFFANGFGAIVGSEIRYRNIRIYEL